MRLKVLGSGSSGNCYLLMSDEECLVIEAGLPFKEIKVALGFDLSKIVGALCSHSHLDHSKSVEDFRKSGIAVVDWQSKGAHRLGNFTAQPFELVHDVPCVGFYITHPDLGSMVYASDTEYVKWKFKAVNHILAEANHDIDMLDIGTIKDNRSIQTHMSLQTCLGFIKANESPSLQSVTLCHLSETTIDPDLAYERASSEFPYAHIHIAEKGTEIMLDIPF